MPDYIAWLEKGLTKPGVDAAKVADALDLNKSAVYKMLYGTRKFKIEELPKIASAIGEPVPMDGEAILPTKTFSYRKHITLNTSGVVSAGAFAPQAPGRMDDETVVFRDETFAKVQHMVFAISGKILESQCIHNGDKLFCLDFDGIGNLDAIKEGTPVVVERTRNGKQERAVKIATYSKLAAESAGDIAVFVPQFQAGNDHAKKTRSTNAVKIVAMARQVIRTFT